MSATADFVVPHRALQRYILADEKVIIATHRHWAMLWEPILTTAAAFVLALALLVAVDPDVRNDLGWAWLPFAVLGARLLYRWMEWRARWFVMTDRRLLLLDGFLVHRVAMMPSEKVTDLGYERTPIGQLLGYGTFIFETAGQDQALDRVTWVPRPDARYRLIIASLFHPDAADAEAAAQTDPAMRAPVAPPVESPSLAPPALMPRIGRRSNPPTQRIELPAARSGDVPGGTAEGGTQHYPAGGAAVPGSGESPGISWTTTGGARAGGAAESGAAGSGAAAPLPGGGHPTVGGQSAAERARAEQAGAEQATTARARQAAGGEHVPGGPTASTDSSEVRPEPFIEGGKDPKIR